MGGNLIIGAPGETGGGNAIGRAYLFNGALTGVTNVPLLTMLDPSPIDFDGFGASVSGAGGRILVGTPGWDAGGAYLFDAAQTGTTNVPILAIGVQERAWRSTSREW